MKKKARQELHQLSQAQLRKEITKQEKEVSRLRLELRAGKLKNVHQLMNQRHQLARLKTIAKEKELVS